MPGWSGREGEYSCRGSGRFAGVGEVMALRQGHAFTRNLSLAAVSEVDMTISVMCTLRGAQATEKAAQLGLFLMCRLRFEEYQPTDFQQKPTRHGPIGHKPATKFNIRTKAHSCWRI